MLRDYDALHRYLAVRRSMPFAWGREANDCVSYAAGAVEAQTGREILSLLPRWTTERGAQRVLARLGGLEAAVDGMLRPVPLALAQRGDIAMVRNPGDGAVALMVIEGDLLSGPDASGARILRRPRMVKAWSAA